MLRKICLIFAVVINSTLCDQFDFSNFKNEFASPIEYRIQEAQEQHFPTSSEKWFSGTGLTPASSSLSKDDLPLKNQNSNQESHSFHQAEKDKQPNFPKSSNTALGRNRPEHTPPEKSVNPIFDNFFLKPFMKINKRQSSALANNQPGYQIIQPQRNKLPNTIPEVMELLSSFGRRTVAEKDSKFSSNTKKDAKQFKKVDYSSPRNVSNLEDKYKGPEKLSHQITLPLLLSQLMNSFRDISRSSQKLEKGFLNLPNFFGKVRREDSETKSPAKKNLPQENGPVTRRRSFLFNLPDLISGFSSKPSATKLSNKSGGLFNDRLPSFKSPGFSQKTDRNGISNQEPPATVYKKSTDEFQGSAPDLKSQTFPSSETINKGNPSFRSLLQQRVNTDPIEKYSPRTTQNQNFAKKSDQTNTATSRRLDKPPIIIYQGKAPPVHVFEKSQAR